MEEDVAVLLEKLKLAVDTKSEDVHSIADRLVSQIGSAPEDVSKQDQIIGHLGQVLLWDKAKSIAKAAETIAEFAKSETGRDLCLQKSLVPPLVSLLKHESPVVATQASRALGNICFESDVGRQKVLDVGGLEALMKLLQKACKVGGEDGRKLRNVSAGFLLNLLNGQEELQQKVLEMGVLETLYTFLETDQESEEVANHVLLFLGLLTDSEPGRELLDRRACEMVVHVLESTCSAEVTEMCLDLLHSQAESDAVKTHLAKAGLCETLVRLLKKHKPSVDDDEGRNMMKVACDLVVLILTGDDSMNHLYGSGCSDTFKEMVGWLESGDEDLEITGALAMGNFARTDAHCIQLVDLGVIKKLLALMQKNNTPAGDIRLQHALLSALRNLAIPPQNKERLLEEGLVETVLPMTVVPTFPVVFKLLGTLRMVIDGQEVAATKLGENKEVIGRLVDWCHTEDHPGVRGEANRLLAWIIKSSRSTNVMKLIVEVKGLPCLVSMITAEHTVMQNEALIAVALMAATLLNLMAEKFVDAGVGHALTNLLNSGGQTLPKEVLLNVMTAIDHLAKNESVRTHLVQSGLRSALTKLIGGNGDSQVVSEANRVAAVLDSS